MKTAHIPLIRVQFSVDAPAVVRHFCGPRLFCKEHRLVWLSMMVLFACVHLAVGDMVVNGDFESSALSPWTCSQQMGGQKVLHRLADTTSYGRQCLAITGDPSNRYNGFIALVQPLPKLKQGGVYVLSARVRAGVEPQGKKCEINIRESNDKGETIRYVGITANLAEDVWKYHEISMKPNPYATTWQIYITTSNLAAGDTVLVDNVRLVPEGDSATPFNPAVAASATETTLMETDDVLAEISKTTGLLHSLSIGGKTLQPAAENGCVVAIEMDGVETRLDGRNTASSCGFRANAEYAFVDGMFREIVTVVAEKAIADVVKISVRHGFDPSDWTRHIDWLRPLRLMPATGQTMFSYNSDINDLNLGVLDTYQATAYPAIILESPGWYLLLASRNLDEFVTLSPNHPRNYLPSLQRNPKSVKVGDTYRFETNWKLFDRRKVMLRDVCRFYQEHLQTSNPLLTKFFPVKYPEPRHFYHGIFGSHTYAVKEREDRLPDGANVWFYSMHDNIRERYPIEDEWWSNGNAWASKVKATELKEYMAYLQNERHFNLIMYLRQLANLKEREKGAFPEDWYKRTPGGALHLYGGGYQVKLPPHVAADVGYDSIPLGQHNFANPNFRRHYVKEIFAYMNYYSPRAIGWDMGSDLWEFSVIAETYDRLRQDGHKIRVVANEGAGPTIAYSDMVLLENGLMGGKHPEDFEVVKAFNRSVVCLERWNIFQLAYDVYRDGRKTWLSGHGIASNKRYLDYLYSRRPELKGERIESARLCQLRASLYDLALGASPGYLEEAKPVPTALMNMAADANGFFGINDSFAITFANGMHGEGGTYAAGWQLEGSIRLAVFNDNAGEQPCVLRLDKAVFKPMGCRMDNLKSSENFLVTPEGETRADLEWSESGSHYLLKGTLPAFSAWMVFTKKQ